MSAPFEPKDKQTTTPPRRSWLGYILIAYLIVVIAAAAATLALSTPANAAMPASAKDRIEISTPCHGGDIAAMRAEILKHWKTPVSITCAEIQSAATMWLAHPDAIFPNAEIFAFHDVGDTGAPWQNGFWRGYVAAHYPAKIRDHYLAEWGTRAEFTRIAAEWLFRNGLAKRGDQ